MNDSSRWSLNCATPPIASPPTDAAAFAKRIATAIRPYNTAGLCNPERHNMYPFTGLM